MISREIPESMLRGSLSRPIPRPVAADRSWSPAETRRVEPRLLWIAVGSGVAACLWFLFLSWRLLALPGTAIATDVDHIFDADPGTRTRIIIGLREPQAAQTGAHSAEERSAFRIPRHPFAGRVWPLLGQPVHRLMSVFFQEPLARIHAARLVCAIVGGFGVACLVLLIALRGVHWRVAALAATVYLGFTSHAISAMPELMGLAAALLSATLLVHHLAVRPSVKLAAFALLAIALGGTTIVLALFPLLCMLWLHPAIALFSPLDFTRRHSRLLGIGVIALVACAAVESDRLQSLFWRAGGWERVGLAREDVRWMTTDKLTNPAAGLAHVVLSFVYPAVGPDAETIGRHPNGGDAYLAVTYEPWRLDAYGWLNGLGAAAWLVMLTLTLGRAWRDPAERPTIRLLGVWIAFNIAMHLVWGREVFLYAPHWSWAVFALTLGGLKGTRIATMGVLAAAIIAGQLAAFASILRAVQIIIPSL